MKKSLSLVLALLLTISCLSGCQSTAQETSSQTAKDSEPSTELTSAADTQIPPDTDPPSQSDPESVSEPESNGFVAYTLPIMEDSPNYVFFENIAPNVAAYMTDYGDNRVMQEWQKRTGISLSFISVDPNSATEKFGVLTAAGSVPDITDSGINYYPGSRTQAVDEGIFADLAAYSEYCPNYLATCEAYDLDKAVKTEEGHIVQFYHIDPTPSLGEGLIVRKDWLDALNLDVPETYDEIYEMLVAFQAEYGCESPMVMRCTGDWNNGLFSWGYGLSAYLTTNPQVALPLYVQDGTVHFSMMEDAYYDYLSMITKWYSEGLIYKDIESVSRTSGLTDMIVTGETGLFYNAASNYNMFKEQATDSSFDLAAVPAPKLHADDVQHFTFNTMFGEDTGTPCTVNYGWNISANAEQIEQLIQCVDYFYTEEGTLLANYGIEGSSFAYNADGKPQFTTLITDNPDGYTIDGAIYYYCTQTGPYVADPTRYEITYTDKTKEMRNVWTYSVEESYNFPSSYVSLSVEDSEVASAILADLDTTISEYILGFIKGNNPLNETSFDEFRAVLTDLGVETYLDIYQQAYDRYIAE